MRHRLLSLVLASSLFGLISGVAGWFWCQLFNVGRDSAFAGPFASSKVGLAAQGHGAACAALVGALAGLLLMPAMLRRAGRARRGSIVARADVRALVATVAGLIGCSTGLSLLDWPAAAADVVAPPRGAMPLLVIAGALVLLVLLVDVVVAGRVERWAWRIAVMDEAPSGAHALPADRVDLGLGDGIVAPSGPGTAYRGGGRLLACVIGDIDEALAALRQCVRRGAVLLALLEAVGIAHGIARGTDAAAHYEAWLCDEVRPSACRDAALLAERAGLPEREASRLHDRACGLGQEESCLALDLMARLERSRQ